MEHIPSAEEQQLSSESAPAIVMSDCDQAQLNAILAVYPNSMMLLCWLHVLFVMWMHFWMEEFPRL